MVSTFLSSCGSMEKFSVVPLSPLSVSTWVGRGVYKHNRIIISAQCHHSEVVYGLYTVRQADAHSGFVWVHPCTQERRLPAVHLLLGVASQLQRAVVFVHVPKEA